MTLYCRLFGLYFHICTRNSRNANSLIHGCIRFNLAHEIFCHIPVTTHCDRCDRVLCNVYCSIAYYDDYFSQRRLTICEYIHCCSVSYITNKTLKTMFFNSSDLFIFVFVYSPSIYTV